ncbi:disintegrin and metalloproteinase domain-containing protein 12 isoform X2 [Rhineura floridana]|uniref:disintegrin and metalloproteinase domain-containing protein 12 isoform X2 n=1 Tax=Rhineura floridana TaxID=261503 RepID=UPI002AC85242|nr:disintegrin and metalloproteinase domain-containing protein 12 isoform X2 [Rhineura floridana]
MSKRLHEERLRYPPSVPPIQLLFLLLFSVPSLLIAPSSGVQGEDGECNLEFSRPQIPKNQPEHYEIIVPYLLSSEQWKPIKSFYSQTHPAMLKLLIQTESEQLVISLERNDGLFASNFTETHYLEDGTSAVLMRNYTAHCYYHGHVQDYAESAVSLSTCSGLRGLILFEDNAYILEPLEGTTNEHIIYQAKNLQLALGTCGHHPSISGIALENVTRSVQTFTSRHKREALKSTKYVELIIVADNREFQRQGKDVEKVKLRLIEIANYVDKFYRPLNIRIALVGVEVWNDMDKCTITQDPFTSLHEFLDWRKLKLLPRKPHDNAQLLSGVYFQGTTIGMAPIMSMCTAEQSGGIVMDHSDSPLGAAVTLAHELGHNFGMNHDTLERGCNCKVSADKGGCIMNPSTGYPFPMMFSSCSKKDLESSLEKGVGMCLFNLPEVKESFGGPKCGNGYVEEGEECDCGEPEECTNECCNATTCTLKPGAVCAHGLCCEDCKLKPAGVLCRHSSNSCDLPEFCTGGSPHCPGNVYLHDGHPCQRVDGYCYNGMCQTHEQQCITLWGPGAKPAPGICFERVNSAGDPYGNCGKDSKSYFAKCEPRDAKCGKIQCQGGANRPVIGTNAVSIETNIPLQEGGKILCRGTHVYLGDDMPDPGLVLAGTKCEDGKVCNNKKNCHCEAHWAPPFCNKAGFGGSVDSGPVRQSDKRSLIIGLLITTLCLLVAGLLMYIKRKIFIRLFFINKKTTIEKLRSVSPARPSSSFEPNHVPATALSKNLVKKSQNVNTHKINDPQRLLRYHTGDISNPVKTQNIPRSSPPERILPPFCELPCQQSTPRKLLPANPSPRHDQVSFKPSPPQKPLPADPQKTKSAQFNSSSREVFGLPKPVPQIAPLRPAPKQPLHVPRSCNTAYMK